MAISDDFAIDIKNKIISHVAGSTIYAVNELYSYLQDYFDDILMLSLPVPMSAQTPSEYSLINGWYLLESAIPFINQGSIKTLGYDAVEFGDGIYITKFNSIGYVNCDPSDIGKEVTCSGNSGILLEYNNTLRKWWIRKSSGSTWSGATTITGGTGAGTITTVVTGESLFANIYTIGELESTVTNTIYIEQINPELTNNKISQFWGNEHIDILIKVKEASSLIDSGMVKVYVREYGCLFTHFKSNLSSGGRNPIPLSTLIDSNNTTLSATVAGWNDVTITFGSITRDLGEGPSTYNVEIDCGNRTSLKEVYERLKYITNRTYSGILNGALGSFYRSAVEGYRETLQSPFGTFTGGKFYGTRGIWLKNVPYQDLNNFQLTDSSDTYRLPKYTSIGLIKFGPNLTGIGSNSVYRMFYKQISNANGTCSYGTENAVMVLKDDNVTPISGAVNSSQLQFDYDFDGNIQTGWIPNHSYTINDEFRNNYIWYRTINNYTSGGAFSITDTTNTVQIEGPSVVLIAIGLANAQYIKAEGTISRTTENLFDIDSALELNYAN